MRLSEGFKEGRECDWSDACVQGRLLCANMGYAVTVLGEDETIGSGGGACHGYRGQTRRVAQM